MNLIFDLDGTLWDSRHTIIEAWNDVLKAENIERTDFTIEDMKPFIGLPQLQIVKELFPDFSLKKCEELEVKLTNAENEYLGSVNGVLYPKVEDTLRKLKENHSLFIVSNCGEGYIEKFLDSFNFHALFTDFESFGRTKTSKAENIALVMKRNNLEDAIYIGDTASDQKSAKANNLPFVFCEYGFGNVEDFDYKISNFEKILMVFKH